MKRTLSQWANIGFWICCFAVCLNLPVLIMAKNRHDDVGVKVAVMSMSACAIGAWVWRRNGR